VRIAAGVSVWKKVEVALYLRGPALLLLGENAEDLGLVDAENYARYFPLLREERVPIYAQEGAGELARRIRPAMSFEEISDARLAEIAADGNSVLHF
jgi:hypothetical protein